MTNLNNWPQGSWMVEPSEEIDPEYKMLYEAAIRLAATGMAPSAAVKTAMKIAEHLDRLWGGAEVFGAMAERRLEEEAKETPQNSGRYVTGRR